MPKEKVVSVRGELFAITNAVRGAQVLAEHAEGLGDVEVRRLVPVVAGVLALVGCRLRDLERTIHGDVNPALFFAPHNAGCALPPNPDEADVLLPEWVPDRLERYATRILRLAESERRERETADEDQDE